MGAEYELVAATDDACRVALGDEGWDAEHERGAAMTLEEAVAYALDDPPQR